MTRLAAGVLGVLAGFAAAKLLAGPATGLPGVLPSLVFRLGAWRLHLHHWLWAGILLAALFILTDGTRRWSPDRTAKALACGLLAGIILQGLFCYSDWWRVVYRAD